MKLTGNLKSRNRSRMPTVQCINGCDAWREGLVSSLMLATLHCRIISVSQSSSAVERYTSSSSCSQSWPLARQYNPFLSRVSIARQHT